MDGKSAVVLGLIWTIILYFQVIWTATIGPDLIRNLTIFIHSQYLQQLPYNDSLEVVSLLLVVKVSDCTILTISLDLVINVSS